MKMTKMMSDGFLKFPQYAFQKLFAVVLSIGLVVTAVPVYSIADYYLAPPSSIGIIELNQVREYTDAEIAEMSSAALQTLTDKYDNPVEAHIAQGHAHKSDKYKDNIRRLLGGVTGNMGAPVYLPIDQGIEHGTPPTHLPNILQADKWAQAMLCALLGMSGLVVHPKSFDMIFPKWADKISLIVKLNASSAIGGVPKTDQHSPLYFDIAAVDEEMKKLADQGAAAVGFTIYPGSRRINQQMDELNAIKRAAEKYGMPTIVWSYPRGGDLTSQDETAIDTHADTIEIGAQAGAWMTKVKPIPGDHFRGEPTPADIAAFEKKHRTAYDPTNKNSVALMKELSGRGPSKTRALMDKHGIPHETKSERMAAALQLSGAGRYATTYSGGAKGSDEIVLREVAEVHYARRIASEALGHWVLILGSIVGRNSFQREWKDARDLIQKVQSLAWAAADQEMEYATVDAMIEHAYTVVLPQVKAKQVELAIEKGILPADYAGNNLPDEFPPYGIEDPDAFFQTPQDAVRLRNSRKLRAALKVARASGASL